MRLWPGSSAHCRRSRGGGDLRAHRATQGKAGRAWSPAHEHDLSGPGTCRTREIPLESRIIHVADAYEAMTSDRPYRKAPGERFAIEELRRNAGTQFDEDVVDALLQVLGDRSKREDLAPKFVAIGRDRAAVDV
jgi:hypothetical protein